MCVPTCESRLYKYKVLMMAGEQLKEGGEDRQKSTRGRKDGAILQQSGEKKVQIKNPAAVINLLFTVSLHSSPLSISIHQ